MLQLGLVTLSNSLTRKVLNEGNFNPALKADCTNEENAYGVCEI
jgi:hypothetical protein